MNPISLAGQQQLMQWSAPAKAISALTEYGPSVAQAFLDPTMSVPLASYVVINLLSNNIDLKSYPTAYRIIQTVMSPFSLCKGAIENRIRRKIDLPLRVVTHTSLSTLVLHILKKIPPNQGSGLSLILCHVCVIEITYMLAKGIYEVAQKLLNNPKKRGRNRDNLGQSRQEDFPKSGERNGLLGGNPNALQGESLSPSQTRNRGSQSDEKELLGEA